MESACEVVVVVANRLVDAFADSLEAGKVDACIERELFEDGFQVVEVKQVDLAKDDEFGLAGDLRDALEGFLGGIVKVVYDDDLVVERHELEHSVGANVAGAAGDQDGFVGHHGGVQWARVSEGVGDEGLGKLPAGNCAKGS